MYQEWAPYVPVAERRRRAKAELAKLFKSGKKPLPVEIEGKKIAQSFWGKGWCEHLESFSDYENRLPRGRTYVRNGSVCHIEVLPHKIEAYVAGSVLYSVVIKIRELPDDKWKGIKSNCSGKVGSLLELLQGRISGEVMEVVSDRKSGLFPLPKDITMSCSCPDWADMCKHVAAALYGVGHRLDSEPELLFRLRGVDPQELVSQGLSLSGALQGAAGEQIGEDSLGGIFGIEIDDAKPVASSTKKASSASSPARAALKSEAKGAGSTKASEKTTKPVKAAVSPEVPKKRRGRKPVQSVAPIAGKPKTAVASQIMPTAAPKKPGRKPKQPVAAAPETKPSRSNKLSVAAASATLPKAAPKKRDRKPIQSASVLTGTGVSRSGKKSLATGVSVESAPKRKRGRPPRSESTASEPFAPTGPAVKNLRSRTGLSVSRFAARVGVTSSTIYSWEKASGKITIHERSLKALKLVHSSCPGTVVESMGSDPADSPH